MRALIAAVETASSRWMSAGRIVALAFMLFAPTCAAADDAAEIAHIIKHTWEKPDAIISVAPVSIDGGYAVAGWIQGERGGRALLKMADKWSVILCSGDGIRSGEGLRAAGVPDAISMSLAAKMASAEAALPAADVAKFSLFEGSVPATDDGHAPHHHDHHHRPKE